jgi:hypothetical protein
MGNTVTKDANEGAKISQRSGVSSPSSANSGSVYSEAHKRASPQTPVIHTLYDSRGRKLLDSQISNAVKVEWSVTNNGKSKIIQTFP